MSCFPFSYSKEEAIWGVGVFTQRIGALRNCLAVSLTLQYLLAAVGVSSKLRLGVKREENLRAHAWLELNDGEIIDLLSDSFDNFTPLLQRDLW